MLPKKRGKKIWTQKNFGHKNKIFGQKFFDNIHPLTRTFYVKNLFWLKILICVKQERDVLQERKEYIFNYLNLFLTI